MTTKTVPVIDIPAIQQALGEEELLERALLDCIQEFSRHACVGRPIAEAIVVLDSWRNLFEKMRRHGHDPAR